MKTRLLFSFLTIVTVCLNAQIVSIPDANFKNKLLQANSSNTIAQNLSGKYFKIDSNSDGQIQSSEAQQVSYLDVSNSNISSLQGIEDFVNIKWLSCGYNQITNLDVSNNLALTFYLDCRYNKLLNLDVSKNNALQSLVCDGNQLITLDVTKNTALLGLNCSDNLLINLDISKNKLLGQLYCNNNQLKVIDVSMNSSLYYLNCSSNQLTSLNLKNGHNYMMTSSSNPGTYGLDARSNPSLTCIQVDDVTNSSSYPRWFKDTTASYSTDCSATMSTTNISKKEVFFYPNPATTIFNFSEPLSNLQILDKSDKQVISQKESTKSISVQKLPKGNYLLTAKGQNGKTVTQKFIKE